MEQRPPSASQRTRRTIQLLRQAATLPAPASLLETIEKRLGLQQEIPHISEQERESTLPGVARYRSFNHAQEQSEPPKRASGLIMVKEKPLSHWSLKEPPLSERSVAELAEDCIHEMQKYYREASCDETYGLELFRRATVLHDPSAWEALQYCFSEVARSWLHRHPRWEIACTIDSEENYVAQAFTRLWYASTKNDHLHFKTLSSALGYLRASLNGAIKDSLQSYSRPKEIAWSQTEPIAVVLDELDEGEELWAIICSLLSNEREIRVAYLHFRCGLKAREILQFCPQEFKDAQEIYRIRRTMLKRLMRNADQIRWKLSDRES